MGAEPVFLDRYPWLVVGPNGYVQGSFRWLVDAMAFRRARPACTIEYRPLAASEPMSSS